MNIKAWKKIPKELLAKEYKFQFRTAFLIPFLVMVLGCILKGMYPFGNNSFLRSDLYNQYVQFLQEFYHKIWAGEALDYSFQLGIGSSFSALFGYYLSSPTNWLVLLVPKGMIVEFITLMTMIKVGLAGLCFSVYISKRYQVKDIGILIFSSAYALSGFLAAYQWNIMWLDVVVLAPLVILALEKLIHTGEGRFYGGVLALAIFSNFYLSIMLCIFLVVYFLVYTIGKPIKIFLLRGLQFGCYSALAGAISGALLLPVYIALSGTEFHEFNFPTEHEWYMNPLEFIMRHGMHVNMKVQYDHWPNVYVGIMIFLLVPLFITNTRISKSVKIRKLLLVLIFAVSFASNMLDFIWHGMNYPDSLPGRQAFLYTFVLLTIGFEVYRNRQEIKLYEAMISVFSSITFLMLGAVFVDIEGVVENTFLLSFVFWAIYSVALLLYVLRRNMGWNPKHVKMASMGIIVIVIIELFTNLMFTSLRITYRDKFWDHYDGIELMTEHLASRDQGFYRVELFDRLTKNDGMMSNLNTATVFSSTINANVNEMFDALGMGTSKVSYWFQGATPFTSALLGVTYMIGDDDSYENDLYNIVYEQEETYLYETVYSLPMAYAVEGHIVENYALDDNTPIQIQNNIVSVLGLEGKLFSEVEAVKENDRKQVFTPEESGYYYLWLGNNALTQVNVTKGEEETEFKQVSFDYILDIGYVEAGQEVLLEVEKESQEFDVFQMYQLDLEVLDQVITTLGKNPLEITAHDSNSLEGQIILEEAATLIVSIPVEEGWSVYVNEKEVVVDTFLDAFFAIDLEAGISEVRLEYKTPYAMFGWLITAFGIFFYGIAFFVERKRFQSQNKK